jgi:hypothetical protein
MKQCLPKVDPKLVHELLQILKTEQAPMYTIEVYLNTDKNIDEIRRAVAGRTGEVATFIDEGKHMIAAHRITLELLEEISKHDDVDKIKGTRIYRGTVSLGPSGY